MADTVTQAPSVKDLLYILVDKFPQTFSPMSVCIRPLKVGIYHDLVAQCPDLDPAMLRRAIRFYTGLTSYQQALATENAMRLDLAGAPVEPVSPDHAQWAKARLATGRTKATPKPSTNGTAPVGKAVWCDHPAHLLKGIMVMSITASLKLVLRDPLPQSRVKDGYRYFALQNLPKGVPAGVTLEATPLSLGCSEKQWAKALKTAEQIRQQGLPAFYIIEAHVGVKDGALIALGKGIQVVEGKPVAAKG